MSESSKYQPYTHSLKTVAFSDLVTISTLCDDVVFFYITPPEDAITMENLYTRVVLEFDSAVSVGNRMIESIGIADTLDHDLSSVNYLREFDVNQSADADRIVDVYIDLSSLLKKDNVTYRDTPGVDADGCTYVFIKLPTALNGSTNLGKIKLWKIDGLYTTMGIR